MTVVRRRDRELYRHHLRATARPELRLQPEDGDAVAQALTVLELVERGGE
jgi:hypothetical protein